MTSNDIIIVTTYPNTPEKLEVLRRCLLQLKKTGKEILLASHCLIDTDITKLADYYIYDSRNEIITEEEYTQHVDKDSSYYYYDTSEFIFYIKNMYNYYHYFAIYQLFETAFKYAQALHKRWAYLLEGDVIVQDDDLQKLDNIKNRVINNNKAAYFQYNGDFAAYSVTFFFIEINFFLQNMHFVKTKKEYIEKYKSRMFIENVVTTAFETAFGDKKDSIEIDEWGCHHNYLCAFPNSKHTTNLSNIASDTINQFQKSGVVYTHGAWHLFSIALPNSVPPIKYSGKLTKNGKEIDTFAYDLSIQNQYYCYILNNLDLSDGSSYNLLLTFFCNGKQELALDLEINEQTKPKLEKVYQILWKNEK